MPRITLLQTNFTAGELSPQLYGRVDIAKYANGAKRMRDLLPQVYGGAKRRPGTLFVNEVKNSTQRVRLIPFIRSNTDSYVLEFGHLYVRFYKNGARIESSPGVPYEIASPYIEAHLPDIDYCQGADTMFLFHESVAPVSLVSAGDTSWTIGATGFLNIPYEEPGTYPAFGLTPNEKSPLGLTITLTASGALFNAGHVGYSVKINGGIVKLTTFTDSTHMDGVIKQELGGITTAPPDAWSLHAPAWSVARGYPRTGTLFEQRLVCGGSPTFPQTIWGSTTGAYLDFTQGISDDDSFSFTAASDTLNPIRFLASNKVLLALTTGGEFTVSGGVEKALSPTNAQIKAWTNFGCAGVRPVRYRNAEIFVQRAGRKLRKFSYNAVNEDWTAPDMSVLAEHLTASGISEMCWQQEPSSIVWIAREDGALASITMDAEQDVTAWALHEGFSGTVESLACIPSATGDVVWMVVQRTVSGGTKRFIERLDESTAVDCAIVTSGAAATVWGGLAHLEGREVDAVADGAYAGRYTVASGQITLARSASAVNIGLPFTSRLTLLDPELQSNMGSASGNAMRTSEIALRFNETTGCKVNGTEVPFRQVGAGELDQPPESFTGVKRIENLGFDRGTDELEITQELPMPFHLLSVTRKFTVNDG